MLVGLGLCFIGFAGSALCSSVCMATAAISGDCHIDHIVHVYTDNYPK